jgi:hypothetical protein
MQWRRASRPSLEQRGPLEEIGAHDLLKHEDIGADLGVHPHFDELGLDPSHGHHLLSPSTAALPHAYYGILL